MLITLILFETGWHFNSRRQRNRRENDRLVLAYAVDFVSEMKLGAQLRMLKY